VRKKKPDDTNALLPQSTVIGEGIRLEVHRITGQEPVVVNGTILGDIDLESHLAIGTTGVIIGTIHAKQLVIAGKVKGTINCETSTHLTPTAYIDGSITTNALKTEEGARFNGQCSMNSSDAEELSIELLEIEGKLDFDFDKLSNVHIPSSGLPPVG
jgi:cytoskeletal protein CcmA (bactofilin family)